MGYDEFRRQIGKAGLSLREFADLMKMHRHSITNYRRKGEVPAHLAVIATLLGVMADKKIDIRSVLNGIDIAPKKSRGSAVKDQLCTDKQPDSSRG